MNLKDYKKKLNHNSKEIKYELVSKLNKLCKVYMKHMILIMEDVVI